jgi:phosphate starvation-inducible PhoH-like protein
MGANRCERPRKTIEVRLPDRLLSLPVQAPGGWARTVESAVKPYALSVSTAPGGVLLEGDDIAVDLAGEMLRRLVEAGTADGAVARAIVEEVVAYALRHDLSLRLVGLSHAVRPMSLSQFAFMGAMIEGDHHLVVGVGPAGCGKTHLAIAAGLNAVAAGRAERLVATRPHIMEPGEEISAAVRAETTNDFQLRPIEDELLALLGHAEVQRMRELEKLEVLPLGQMRGRTFNNAFIVIDEAQNLTVRKMRMAVTRMGRGSRTVVVGDPCQVDLHEDEPSGLRHLLQMVSGTDIAFVHAFDAEHIVRNDTVAKLETLYASRGAAGIRAA